MNKIKDLLARLFFFLRLTDEDGLLSITYIACWIVLAKIALEPSPSIAEMGALLVTLSAYYGKRHLARSKKKILDEHSEAIAKIQAKVDGIADKTGALAATLGFRTTNGK